MSREARQTVRAGLSELRQSAGLVAEGFKQAVAGVELLQQQLLTLLFRFKQPVQRVGCADTCCDLPEALLISGKHLSNPVFTREQRSPLHLDRGGLKDRLPGIGQRVDFNVLLGQRMHSRLAVEPLITARC